MAIFMLESIHKSLDCSIYDLLNQDAFLKKNLLLNLEGSGQNLDSCVRIQLQEIRALFAIPTAIGPCRAYCSGYGCIFCSAGAIIVAYTAGAIHSVISFFNRASVDVSAFAMCAFVSLNI